MPSLNTIKFVKANLSHQQAIFGWLDEAHVKEFWDNSQEHRDDILNFISGRITPSSYFNGIFTYWIGLYDDEGYCLIMTSEESEASNPPDYFKPYLSKTGKTIGIDFCIGNKDYLGKGLAAQTLIAFTEYYTNAVDFAVDTYLIDPHTDNPRAINVYEKAGFKIACEYTQEQGYFAEAKGILMVKKMLSDKKNPPR